jgi:glycine/D-amino acid oxidase-like deaminating enzyme
MRSLWLEEANGGESALPLEGAMRADVCVVGGGYTGLWTALRLKELEPAIDVALVEADVCGTGASGRNGGMALSWWSKFRTLERLVGVDEAVALARASADAVAAIGAFCDEHGVDAHYRPDPWLWSATSEPWLGAWRATVERLEALGEQPFREIDGAEALALTGSYAQLGGVVERTAATVQPALLAQGLRRVALERGIEIFERSPVTRLDGARVQATSGHVDAGRIVLALGPWSVQARGLENALVVVSSDMVATEPVPELAGQLSVSVSDARARTEYYRMTHDGRIAFGKGGGTIALGGRIGAAFHGPAPRAAEVEAALRRIYPGATRVAATWTGPVDRSRTGLPFFTRIDGTVVAGAGYSGRGVAQSVLGGRILASLALELDDEWSSCGLVGPPPGRLPPEPFRYAGGLALRAAVAAEERAEDSGRRPSWLARTAVRLAPAGILPSRDNSRR